MGTIDKPYSFHTLFSEKFKVSQKNLGRSPRPSLTSDAKAAFLSEEVEVGVDEIVIPKMQRDYAQGRPNEQEVRDNFLQSLYDAIVDDTGRKRCSLNFIYGQFEELREGDDSVSFIPYDGQQRLTTLFLLHWYASRMEKAMVDYISRFRYDTRFSTTTFTTMFLPGVTSLDLSEAEAKWLAGLKVEGAVAGRMVPVGEIDKDKQGKDKQGVFSQWLTNKNGFARSWRADPTVNGMLAMLDAIHAKFHDVSGLWERLCETDPSKMPIYFFFQEVARSSKAGSIFIKMNSRGKLLTEFECFKADFLRLLREENYPEDLRGKLAGRINKTWERSFWELAKRQKLQETDTDVLLMRYVNFVIDLIGFERNDFESRNGKLHLYSSERLKKVVLKPDGSLNEAAIEELVFAIDTWCGSERGNWVDEYFQNLFCKEEQAGGAEEGHMRIRLFFNPDPKDFFRTIAQGLELPLNAVAVFHAVLVARRLKLASDLLDLRLRSVRNFVYFMDKGVGELPYILQKVRLVMRDGLEVDFSNEKSTRKFIDTQIREEQFKEWLADKDSHWYREIRKLEESDWFKGQVGALLYEVLDEKDEGRKLTFINEVFAKRFFLFNRLFRSGDIPDSIIRKALFTSSENGFDYWVISKGWFWMGASINDFAWKAAHPYFTREGKPQEALRGLLAHSFFDTANGSGRTLMESFANRSRLSGGGAAGPFGVVDYLNRYYDDFFERWTDNESSGSSSCVGLILPGNEGLTMQMLDGRRRSKPYWDPYLYVALKHVDEDSVKENGRGAFKDLFRQYDPGEGCSVIHHPSQVKVWNGPYGVQVRMKEESFKTIEKALREALGANVEIEKLEQAEGGGDPSKQEDGTPPACEWLLRTRLKDDCHFKDQVDRIEVCEKLLEAIKASFPTEGT